MFMNIAIWAAYIALFVFLARKGRGHDAALPGRVGFAVQALAYVATYISAVALVGFGGLAHAYGMQMLLVAAGNVILGTWLVYKYLAWPTKEWQQKLQARTPAALLGLGHNSAFLRSFLALLFLVFLSIYASAVVKGAALLFVEILPLPLWAVSWLLTIVVGVSVYIGGFRGVLYTEAMQGVVMVLGMTLLIGAVLIKVGGPFEGLRTLAALAPSVKANNGFIWLSSGEQGLFVLSLVIVTSVAVWSQPQMIQRHFALNSVRQARRTAPLAMLVLTILVGGTYFAAALSRIFLPDMASPDDIVPRLVHMLLPEIGLQLFILAMASASISTATAIFHIASSALSEDLTNNSFGRKGWLAGIVICMLICGVCAQAKGQFIAIICTTSWSIVGATALIPYLALVRGNVQNKKAAVTSALAGFISCLGWYLLAYKSTALVAPVFGPALAIIPPFFIGVTCSALAFVPAWLTASQQMPAEAKE